MLERLSDPLLTSPTPGLSFTDGDGQLRPQDFPCCAGHSLVSSASGVRICGLNERLQRARKWLKVAPNPQTPQCELPPQLWNQLLALHRGQGRGLHWQQEVGETPLLWRVGMVAIWRFGMRPALLRWNTPNPNHSLAQRRLPAAALASCDLLLIEGVRELWQPDAALDFELLITQAYNADIPLWISFEIEANRPAPEAGTSTLKRRGATRFQAKIAALKSARPESYLAIEAQSKLRELCQEIKLNNLI